MISEMESVVIVQWLACKPGAHGFISRWTYIHLGSNWQSSALGSRKKKTALGKWRQLPEYWPHHHCAEWSVKLKISRCIQYMWKSMFWFPILQFFMRGTFKFCGTFRFLYRAYWLYSDHQRKACVEKRWIANVQFLMQDILLMLKLGVTVYEVHRCYFTQIQHLKKYCIFLRSILYQVATFLP